VEYDPSLAEAAGSVSAPLSKADVLKDEFGFEESDEDEEAGSEGGEVGLGEGAGGAHGLNGNFSLDHHDGGNGGGATRRTGRSTAAEMEELRAELEAQHQEEIDRLAAALSDAQERAARNEELAQRTEERLEELSQMSKQAKNILVAKFRAQLKTLMAQVEEQKQMLAEDDETLESLRAANLALESGDAAGAADIQAKLKEFKESRVLTRENSTLRFKIEELTQQAKQAKDEAAEAREAADAAEARLKNGEGSAAAGAGAGANSEEVAALRARVEQLESERQMFREDIKKRHVERTKLMAKLAKLTAENPSLLDGDADGATVPAAAANGAPSAEQAAENAKLAARVKQLEAALAKAQKMVEEANASAAAANASAASANANAAAAAVSAAQPAQGSGASAEAVAAAVAAATAAAESTAASAASAAAARESELTVAVQKLDELLKRREGEMEEIKEKAKEKLTTASNAIKKLKTEYGTLRAAYQKLREEGSVTPAAAQAKADQAARLARRVEILRDMKKSLSGAKANLSAVKENLFVMNSDIPALGPSISAAVGKFIAGRAGETTHLRDALKKEMQLRRQLFNQIQELKGNIRVYCRVRPMNQREREDPANATVISHPAPGEMTIVNPEKKTSHTFEFERIFDQGKDQPEVFAEVSDLVVSTLDGYNVCIFAYGQTGSGKTYTMQGPKENPGVNIRALTKLFEVAAERYPDIKYEIKVTLLEIYNERIQDLLSNEKGRVLKAVQGQYGMEVQDLTMVSVANEHEVLETLKRGSKNRSVVATAMNDVSSRSHLILSVYVLARNSLTGKDVMGKLHLIDLAGSERVGRSGVQGDAMKEAQAINQSLSALGNVISARANKSSHVPYRDSTLTYLLQDSLEKNSKTLMFVNLSPVMKDCSESICSLRFAERVRKVELGKAEANKKR